MPARLMLEYNLYRSPKADAEHQLIDLMAPRIPQDPALQDRALPVARGPEC